MDFSEFEALNLRRAEHSRRASQDPFFFPYDDRVARRLRSEAFHTGMRMTFALLRRIVRKIVQYGEIGTVLIVDKTMER